MDRIIWQARIIGERELIVGRSHSLERFAFIYEKSIWIEGIVSRNESYNWIFLLK